jgi:nicotinate-nucleotide adenylyltransferase
MEFFRRALNPPRRLGILPGSFNPITNAHLGLACAALHVVEEVLFVLPRVFPHKSYTGASFEERLAMLHAAAGEDPRMSIAASDRGLFTEISQECREAYGPGVGLSFLCGRDAAERILGWDYGRPDAAAEMLRSFELRVAARQGEYVPPAEFAGRVHPLETAEEFDHISATEVRERLRRGERWEHLVPARIAELVHTIYGSRRE